MQSRFLRFLCLISLFSTIMLGRSPSVTAAVRQIDRVLIVSSSTVCFISTLYRDLLNRNPSSTELSNGQTYLSSHTRAQYAATLLVGSEYRTGFIQDWYQKFLGRPANSGEVSSWLSVFGGGTDEQIIASIISSNEYFNQSRVGGTNPGYITVLYQDLLGRPPSAGSGGG